MKHTSLALLASLTVGLLLAGCASVQTEAPVEEASAAQVKTVAAPPVVTTPTQVATASRPERSGEAHTTAAGTQAIVETRPLPTTALTPSPAAASAPAAAANLTTPGAHRDPASPLAQRVIYFEFDSAVIDPRYQPMIEAHATYLKANPGFKVILQGHTDERGSREYNLALGQRRAESVRQALSLLGVPDGQMEAVSFGEEKPAVLGSNEEAWRMNRRTEIHYVGE